MRNVQSVFVMLIASPTLFHAAGQTSPGLTTLYSFAGYPSDASQPFAGVIRAANGVLYGTTRIGPSFGPTAAVYAITPPAEAGAGLGRIDYPRLHRRRRI